MGTPLPHRLREGGERWWGKGQEKATGPGAQAALQRWDGPAPGLAACPHLALGWAGHTPTVMGGELVALVRSASYQLKGFRESMWPGSQGTRLLTLVLPEACSATLGKSQPLSGPLLPHFSNERLHRVTFSSSDILSF